MLKRRREKLKTIILLLLIAASLIQMGIRWDQQFQGLPFNFITQIFNSGDPSADDNIKYQYIIPEAIIISGNAKTKIWKLDQNDSYFTKIWNDIKDNYLPAMIKNKPSKTMPKEQWSIISNNRCIRIDFSVKWPSDIIFSPKTNSGEQKSFNSVKSIAVLPEADVNETVNTVYIYDGSQVYQYSVNIVENFLKKSFYLKIADEPGIQNKPELSVLSANTNFESPEDILVSLDKGKYITYPSLNLAIPPSIVLKQSNIDNNSIQNKILLSQKDSLMAEYNESGGEALFTDMENVYRLFANGILEYKYLPAVNTPAGEISEAFNQAISFIEPRKELLGNAGIVLTSFNKPENENYYEMQFGYKYKGVKLYYSDDGTDGGISSPLIIKANSERVLECRWIIRSVTEAQKPKAYNVYFADLMNEQIPSLYPEIINRERQYYERIEPGYVFGPDIKSDPVYPDWIVSTDSKDYYIPLPEAEG